MKMKASKREIINRTNFLIYEYIVNHLHAGDFAEEFKKLIQASKYKDIIQFKGLNDLPELLISYYSSHEEHSVDAGDATSELPAAANGHVDTDMVDEQQVEDAATNGKKKKKKKKKQKHQQLEDSQGEEQIVAVVQPAGAVSDNAFDPTPAASDAAAAAADAAGGADAADAVAAVADSADAADAVAAVVESGGKEKKSKKKKRKQQELQADALQEQEQQEEQEQQQQQQEQQFAKKRPAQADDEDETGDAKKKRHSQPYRRVREEEIENKHFRDNSFDAKTNATSSWGYKANLDLKPTQGKSFRHEKTKKKRGSYKGGVIDTAVTSVKFDSDED